MNTIPERIKRILLSRRKESRNVPNPRQNRILIYGPGGNLLARISTWINENSRGRHAHSSNEIRVEIESDPDVCEVAREEIRPDAAFPDRGPLLLNEHSCPQCEGKGFPVAASPRTGESRRGPNCFFCKGSGTVSAVFYPNS